MSIEPTSEFAQPNLLLSVVIPAYNEEKNLKSTVTSLVTLLIEERVPYEIIIVDDSSRDDTAKVAQTLRESDCQIKLVRRTPPRGFGRAIRSGLAAASGDAIIICMADESDDPRDVVTYYRKLQEGYDAVFGSRFIRGSVVRDYPRLKLVVNRMVNKTIQWMFWCKFNDLTNAFKAYRRDVLMECAPFLSCHFNITLEMSLGVLIRHHNIAQIPINWYGRTWGSSNLSLRRMGRRYLQTLLKVYSEWILVSDDLIEDRLAHHRNMEAAQENHERRLQEQSERLSRIEKMLTSDGTEKQGTSHVNPEESHS
ncbi:glycosyltransferase family 2 protein [Calycomorphotria hydatis]|uniref:Undecaprenyl-phosphate 4-deoxy-4-formamido-L-arabinose transferase n=1 Tax=Calycomorphotria hydatis TaxID=2528027 RepID=A0A517TED4_9PLAN|nr:glycosyltransferase family 2 protein [Calycomorphotria hydatis]QDT66729.1 Undecaprenyl-phosphate 4-deoxy-4-formamido-L-arabinose transferase [Calycomorphotria hydatis]